MSIPADHLLPKTVLLSLLPASFEPWGASDWYPSRPPTPDSVARVESELAIRVPGSLVEVARACPSYGGWFGSVGDDFESHNHILSINRAFRAEGLSSRYVLLNHGHDGDCDAWDTGAPADRNGELPIVYFNYNCDRRELRGLRPSAGSFAEYVDAFVRLHAPRCPVKGLRRRAKRMLAGFPRSVESDKTRSR
ncbi:MAG TPA: hypothetical protein VEA69_04200 [Tepidisphaeraceae bacterium]|nr:hypothetical protein [Tepidisphaeraceae bacterium]